MINLSYIQGKLTASDIKNALIELGDNPTDAEVKEMLAFVTTNGEVDFITVKLSPLQH